MKAMLVEVLANAAESLDIEYATYARSAEHGRLNVWNYADTSCRTCEYGLFTPCESDVPAIAAQAVVSIMDAHNYDAETAACLVADLMTALRSLRTDRLPLGVIVY